MRIGFIGIGNMGEAILRGAMSAGVVKTTEVFAFDPNTEKLTALMDELGCTVCDSVAVLLDSVEVVLVAVKPNICQQLYAENVEHFAGKAVISIAAGWSQARLSAALPENARILRVMPNTPAMVGNAMTVFELGDSLKEEERVFARRLFESIGRVSAVESHLMDAVTAVSGSGPAYVYMFIEALADGGVLEGLPRKLAYELAAQTVLGGAKMVLETGEHPGKLKDNVCSPGGTTIEAVAALEETGMRAALITAVKACAHKSALLSKLYNI